MLNVDTAQIQAKGGNGGNGCIAFRREKFVPRGGPNGGDGGKGGDVILESIEGMTTLIDLKYQQHQRADNGQHGMGKLRNGKDANDRIIKVPVGTIVRWVEAEDLEKAEQVLDLKSPNQRVIIAHGGIGGRGNPHFRSSTFQTPRVAEKGEPGEEVIVDLEVKLIADVGLVGYPNAGKSTLLARTSAAKPKIANYPFTTLSPNLGVVRVATEQNFVLADIPGLIEGAHTGVGLGHDFLRHVERTKMLIHVIDVASVDGRDPIEDFEKINQELELYNPRLGRIPQVIALNKVDLQSAGSNLTQIEDYLRKEKRRAFPISAVNGDGVQSLVRFTYQLLQRINEKIRQQKADSPPVLMDLPRTKKKFKISQKESCYWVVGPQPKRAVLMTDMDNPQALVLLHRKLKGMGVINALQKAGIKQGDDVYIHGFEFQFTADGK